MQLLLWQNLIFALPALLALLYLFLLAVSGGIGEHDSDVQAGPGIEGGHDIGHDLGHSVAHGAGHDADHDANHGAHPGVAGSLASFVLLGKVPLAVIVTSFLLLWGAIGMAANIAGLFAGLSIPLAFFGALITTRFVARAVAWAMPSTESYSVPREALVGQEAVVTHRLTHESGEARLVDKLGVQRDLPCRCGEDYREIAAGSAVRLVLYDKDKEVFIGWPK